MIYLSKDLVCLEIMRMLLTTKYKYKFSLDDALSFKKLEPTIK